MQHVSILPHHEQLRFSTSNNNTLSIHLAALRYLVVTASMKLTFPARKVVSHCPVESSDGDSYEKAFSS